MLLALTAILWFFCTLWATHREWDRPRLFYFHFMLAETAVLGALLAQDLALFVVFFDLMLVPFFFLTGQWGEGRRVQATMKLVIYTLVGSLLMLTAAIATGVLAASGPAGAVVRVLRPRAAPARRVLAELDLPVLRRRVPREDAGLPAARLDARRLSLRCRCRCSPSSPAC